MPAPLAEHRTGKLSRLIILRACVLALALVVLGAGVQTARAADNTIYVNSYTSPFTIYTLDPSTGALAPVGTLTFSSIAMARRASDGLIFYTEYGVTNGRVYTWNPATNTNTSIGRLGTNVRNFPRLAFDANGVLYGMDDQSHLFTVSTTNGAATPVGGGTGLVANFPASIRGDIAFAPNGTLYATEGDNSVLYTINIGTLTATTVGATGATGQTNIAGMGFTNGGVLYAIESNSADDLSTLSTANGQATVITTLNTALYDMAAMTKFANLSLTKTATGSFVAGTTATYTMTISNTGPHNASGPLTVTDTLPAGVTYSSVSAGWSCSAVGQNVTCSRAAGLNNGANTSFTLTVLLASNVSATIVNSATVSSTTFDHVSANNTDSETTTITFPPDLTISKSHTGNFTQGQIGTYTITVANSGSGSTTSPITVSDTLPAGLSFSSGPPAPWSCSAVGQVVTCTCNTALGAGLNSAFTFNVSVASNAPFSVTNTASVSTTGEINTGNNSASDPTTINGVPDLTITKSHAGNFNQGQSPASYTLTVTNSGTAQTSGQVTVTDTLPAGLTFLSGSGPGWNNCTASGQVVTCINTNTLAAGISYSALTLNVSVAPNAAASVTNSVSVAGGGETNTGNDTASDVTTINGVPDLTIGKSHTGNFTQGQNNATYTITVSNAGRAATSSQVTVTDTLPAGLSFVSGSGAGWNNCTASGQVVTCTSNAAIPALGSASITLTVNVSATAAASVTNTASVSGGGESNTSNNSANDVTTINPVADLTIAKTHTGNFTRGSTGTYNITVTNSGLAQTSGSYTVTDTLPAGLTPTGWSGAGSGWGCSIVSQTVTCTNSNALNAGASNSALTITVSVSQNAASSVTNTATVSGGGQANTSNDTASDPTTIVSSSDLSLTKVTNNSGAGIGTQAAFTVTVTNSGPSNATNVAVRDQLPAGLTYANSIPSVGTYNSGTGVWTVGNLSSGQSAMLQLFATINALGSITNTAQVTASDQPDPDSTPNNNNAAEDDQASSSLSTAPPSVALCKTILGQPCPPGTPSLPPGSDITYVITFTNSGGSPANTFVVTDPFIPVGPPCSGTKLNDYTYFKVGSILNTLPAGLSLGALEPKYSSDCGATWNYAPASGAGGAPAGYDANVTHIRWTFTGALSQIAPNNTGNVSFTVRIK